MAAQLGQEQQAYIEHKLKPLLDLLVRDCMEAMPEDPAEFVHQWLQPVADTELCGDQPALVSKGKAKGEAKGGAKGDAKGDAKGKGKDKGKSAVRSGLFVAKPTFFEMMVHFPSTDQEEDGRFTAEAVAESIEKSYMMIGNANHGFDVVGRLKESHPAVSTGMIVWFFDKILAGNFWEGRHVEVSVQGVGDGRGGAVDREVITAEKDEMNEEEQQMARERKWQSILKDHKPKYGEQFVTMAETWLESQEKPADFEQVCEGLVKEFYKLDYGKPAKMKAISEEERKRKEEVARRVSMERREKNAVVAAHWRSLVSRPVDDVPWDLVRQCKWCSGGMGGATLVQIGNTECVVVKELGANAVAEHAAVEIAHILKVRVAKESILARIDNAALVAAVKVVPMQDGQVDMLASRIGHAPFLMIMEFVPGTVLQGLDGNRVLTSDAAGSVLKQLGALIALDCVLNNVDRVPAIWMNDGNLSNIMVLQDKIVIGIDHQVNAIGNQTGKDKYLALLREFCGDCVEVRVASPSSNRIRTALLENNGVEVDDAQCSEILLGALEVFTRVKAEKAEVVNSIQELEGKFTATFTCDAEVGLSNLRKLIGFCIDCVNVIAESC